MIFINFQKQPPMRKVVYCLFPAFIGSVFFFGWISFVIVSVSVITCVLTEWMFVRGQNGKVTEAVLVTGMLYGLILPPTIPLYMVILGAVFGVTFGKMAFGGFGANVFNPAIVARAFVYITFPVHMTNRWIPAADFSDFPAGFAVWRFSPVKDFYLAVTSATPFNAYREGAVNLPGYLKLFLGNINGQFERLGEVTFIGGGSLGETSAILLLIGGLYLVIKKIANWRIVVSFFAVYFIFQTVLHGLVPLKALNPIYSVLSGGIVLGGFFMITDPVSAARTRNGQWIYGALIATAAILIQSFSLFSGGLMFAILLGNMFAPIIDYGVKNLHKEKKS